MITGTTRFDLTCDDREADREVIVKMYAVPAGARVVLDVGRRSFVAYETAAHLRAYVQSLHLDVHGEPGAVRAWVLALREAA